MDLSGFLGLFGGVALFLYGMSLLGGSLAGVSRDWLPGLLNRLAGSPLRGILLGAAVTAAIQSSSAATVIVVGLVDARVMSLRQAIGVILGANLGTTVTAHLLCLGGGPGLFRFLSPQVLAPAAAVLGILLFLLANGDRLRETGQLFLGFGILFTGMLQMEAAVAPLRSNPAFPRLFQTMSDPLLGLLAGAGVTAVIQSSSASVGILQALSSTGAVTWGAAMPIILGQNVGTCVTPLLAGVGASVNAKRAALAHLLLNLAGSGVFLAGLYLLRGLGAPAFWGEAVGKEGVAWFHTAFNLAVVGMFLPLTGALERILMKVGQGPERGALAPRAPR